MPRSRWLILAVLSFFLMVAATACRNQTLPAAAVTSERLVLTDLESIEQLQAVFNEDSGKPRLLMILAPL